MSKLIELKFKLMKFSNISITLILILVLFSQVKQTITVDCVYPEKEFYVTDLDNAYCKECTSPNLFKQDNECVVDCTKKGYVKSLDTYDCSYCLNGTYEYQNTCIESCPVSTISRDLGYKFCEDCPDGSYIQNNKCMTYCEGEDSMRILVPNYVLSVRESIFIIIEPVEQILARQIKYFTLK